MLSTRHLTFTCLIAILLTTTACSSVPKDVFRLSETSLDTRELQTRRFEDVAERELLVASVGLLQDLGYSIDELDNNLGVISASKRADARREGQVVGRVALDLAKCYFTYLLKCNAKNFNKTDKVQDIRVTLVVLPQGVNGGEHAVRVTMQRVVWDRADRITKQATITDTEVYQEFFSKLDKSVFLEREGSSL